MAATTVKSEGITNIEASPIVPLDRKQGEVKVVIDQGAIAITSVDEAGDKALFCPIPSNAVILDVEVLNDDLDSNACPVLAVDWGLYYSGIGGTQVENGNASGDTVDVDAFASAETGLQAARVVYTSVRFEAADITGADLEAWEIGGLSSDPGGFFYVGYNVTTAAGTDQAGDVVVKVTYM